MGKNGDCVGVVGGQVVLNTLHKTVRMIDYIVKNMLKSG